MKNSCSCRKASAADLGAILQLYEQPDLDNGQVLALTEAERIFHRIRRYPDYNLFVAVVDDRIVGTYALLIMDNLGHMGAPSAVIEDVAVDPRRHGRGIGTAMMRHALQQCRDKGCYKVVVSSNLKRHPAHGFYESLGFERHGFSYCIRIRPPIPAGCVQSDKSS
jgi:GNAT superfamily N-acetyltransferase